jgi:hypothetical protein
MRNLYPTFLFCIPGLLLLCSAGAQPANPKHLPYQWTTDTSTHKVDLSELTIATIKDELPTLDYPKFIHRTDKLYNFYDHEPVIAITFSGQSKAYPLSLLTLFELSNDSLGGKQLMITYCPMCNAAIVYNRKVKKDGSEYLLNFGISGLLMHNDMVMYDKETNSWWEQLMGSAIVGKMTGTDLEMMPALLISAKDYFDRFPQGEILSPEGIHLLGKRHNHRPFHHLNHTDNTLDTTFYLPEKVDPRLPPLERVLDIHTPDHTIIFPFHVLAEKQVVNEVSDKLHYTIFYHSETVTVLDEDKLSRSKKVGSATAFRSVQGKDTFTFTKAGDYFKDEQTGSTWDITGYCREGPAKGRQLWILPHSSHFAFAYLAFFPESIIYGKHN